MAERKRVLMLLSNPFRPDPRVHKEAKSLVDAGYSVTIICWDRDRKHQKRETVDGIEIRRVGPASSFAKTSLFLRTLPIFWRNARREMAGLEFDIIHAHDLDTLSPALRESRRRGIPVVYDSHEIYHEMAAERLPRLLANVVKSYERRMVGKPNAVVCVNDRFRNILGEWGARKLTVVMGSPPKASQSVKNDDSFRRSISPDSKPVVLYIGVLEPHRNLLELADGFIGDKSPKARLLMGGFGSLEKQIAGKKGPRFSFIGPVKPSDLPAYNSASDILVAVYDPAFGNNRDSVPNKLFEAMCAGKPIIVAKGTWTGETVEKIGCGITVSYGTDEVFRAIDKLLDDRQLYDDCRTGGLKAFDEEYSWEIMEKRLLDLYAALLVAQN